MLFPVRRPDVRRISVLLLALIVSTPAFALADRTASLRGSRAAMLEQNQVAKAHGLSFARTVADIRRAVAAGELVELTGNADYEVADFVRWPYLRPEVRLFVERLGAQHREECGQKLVVTSAVRPSGQQPPNAHALSVHPAGMAVDLRVSERASCRAFLERAIMNLERRGVLNGIREYRPPHYHVAVYPGPYNQYVGERLAAEREEQEAERVARAGEELARETAADQVAPAADHVEVEVRMLSAAAGPEGGVRAIIRAVRGLAAHASVLPLGFRVLASLILPGSAGA